VSRVLDRRSMAAKTVLDAVSRKVPQYSHVELVRFIGRCNSCGAETLYCCYKGFSGGMSCQDDFLHFCTNCQDHRFDSQQQQEDLDYGLEAAICPFCGYNWSSVTSEQECDPS
jgi:hypothetical protein